MKKIFLCFISFILILFININVFAKEELIPNYDDIEYENIEYLKEGVAFNYFEIKMNYRTKQILIHYNNLFDENNKKANAIIRNDIYFYSKDANIIAIKNMVTTYKVVLGKISNVVSKIDDETIIDSKIENNEIVADSIYYFDLKEYNPDYELAIVDNFVVTSLGASNNEFLLDLFLSLTYEDLGEEDIYVSNLEDLTLDGIAYMSNLYDKDFNKILNIKIIEEIEELNNYYIKIRGFSINNKALIKKINIHKIDISNLILNKDFYISYDSYLKKEDILNEIIKSEYEAYEIRSDYYNSYNKLGNYKYYLKINILNKDILVSGYINVIDDIKPYIAKENKIIKANINSYLKKEDILKHFIIYDEYDGIIDEKNIILDGYLDYLVGYSNGGDFNIKLIAKDNSLNEISYDFIINVSEDILDDVILEYKILKNENIKNIDDEIINEVEDVKGNNIKNSDYVILAYTNQRLTSLDIQDLLISEGYLNDNDIVSINSDYFSEANLEPGIYPLEVKYDNGDITYYEIKLEKKEIIIEDNTNNNYIPFIILGVILFLGITLIIIMKVYVNEKKN